MNARLDRARRLLAELRVDGLVVTRQSDVRYLSGFRGEDTALLITGDAALICTDARFWAQVGEEVVDFTLEKSERLLADTAAAASRLLGPQCRLGFQGDHLPYSGYRELRRAHRGGLRDAGVVVGRLRVVKDEREVATMRRAAAISDAALEAVVGAGLAGRTEAEVAWDLHVAMRAEGAEDVAFATIVAAGERGALAHAIPGERRIGRGDLVVIDMGARYQGYCSDITRTLPVGTIAGEARAVYETVLAAQCAGLAALRAGAHGHDDVDAAARAVIEAAGYGASFGHGTGHGVGLEIHEAPRLGKLLGDPLAAGMVCTVEPGIYLEGRFGVRIEDTVLVTEVEAERLTLSPRELRLVD